MKWILFSAGGLTSAFALLMFLTCPKAICIGGYGTGSGFEGYIKWTQWNIRSVAEVLFQ